MSLAYYNEKDKYAAQWLCNLISAGHIADGVVDERSIEDVRPRDLGGFTQCHFFAGIGVWSLALRRAGWPDDRPVWTGSCPCQPFSAAGKGAGFADERHLWPAWHHLIGECKPAAIFGEQVASSDAAPWIDLVQDDLEALGYAFGAIPFPAAGVGAPHIRDRLYFVAQSDRHGRQGRELHLRQRGSQQGLPVPGRSREVGDLANSCDARLQVGRGHPRSPRSPRGRRDADAGGCEACALGYTHLHDGAGRLAESHGRSEVQPARSGPDGRLADAEQSLCGCEATASGHVGAQVDGPADRAGGCGGAPLRSFWADADWIPCRDGKARPVEPGTFPLAHGAPARVGRLRAYGNAINAEAARVFIESVMETA